MTSRFRSMSKLTRFTISLARPRQSITSAIRCRRPKLACTAPSICWGSPSASERKSCKPRPRKSTATPTFIRRREDYWGRVNPIGPRSCYDEGKRCAETLFFDYWRQHQLRIKVARIFNTYGPRMHPNDGRVVSNFIVQALMGMTSRSTATAARRGRSATSMISSTRLVRLMNTDRVVTGPINIGNPAEFSIRELATMVIAMTGSRSRIVNRPLPADDPRQRRPDISQAQEDLNWTPKTPIKDGLVKTIAYFEKLLSDNRIRKALTQELSGP